jgi:MoaA/NifB/PqqE/SkfB family radical SAM enzyme
MTKRKMKKMFKRAIHLPIGWSFFKYLNNKIHSYTLTKNKSLEVAYPSTIMIEVTNHCNLRCIVCPRETVHGNQMDKGYMNFGKLKMIVDQAYPYIDSIGLTGLGETFLYKDIVEAVKYIKNKSKGVIVSCSINAHIANCVEIASQLVGLIDTIQISMDGLEDTYNHIRVGGDFNFFKENLYKISMLANNTDTHIMLNVVLVKENYHQMAAMVDFAAKMKIHYLNMRPINLSADTKEDVSYNQFFFSDEFKKELNAAKATAKKYNDLEFTCSELKTGGGFNTCIYPWNYFYITWDGYLPLCCGQPFPKELNFGNVFRDGLMASLNSEAYQEFRKLWYGNKTPELCKNCTKIFFGASISDN